MSPSASSTKAAGAVRPAVYGRNYSYFSHRIFVALMPEDLHRYLQQLLVHDESDPANDSIDIQLVRWVLLHRSELNALALNRLLESWRDSDDMLRLPSERGLREPGEYSLDITLQVAVETALATAQEAYLAKRRPRLQMPLLDAAYYVSRQRAHFDRRGQRAQLQDAEHDLDLSVDGRQAFADYLRQRMNLQEDRRPGDEFDDGRPSKAAHPLSDEEIDWLQGVAIDVAKSLCKPPQRADEAGTAQTMFRRWIDCNAPGWSRRGLAVPPPSFDQYLLTGEQSPLIELPPQAPSDAGDEEATDAVEEALGETLRFRWRVRPFEQRRSARSLTELATSCDLWSDFITEVETTVVSAVHGPATDPRKLGLQQHPLRALASTYGLLPATPSWEAVHKARDSLQQAKQGRGSLSELYHDANVLKQYAEKLQTRTAATAVALMLVLGAVLAGMRPALPHRRGLFSSQAGDATRPSWTDWNVVWKKLADGLRFDDADLGDRTRRLEQTLAGLPPHLRGFAMPVWPVFPHEDPIDVQHLNEHWPEAARLSAQVSEAFAHARAVPLRPDDLDVLFTSAAWHQVLDRLDALSKGVTALPPAGTAEIVCAVCEAGPAALGLSLDLQRMGARSWTQALLKALSSERNGVQTPGGEHIVLAAHALERLGLASLRNDLRESILGSLRQRLAPTGPQELAARRAQAAELWSTSGHSDRVALVLGPSHETLAESWGLPPRLGLLLAITPQDVADLKRLGIRNWSGTTSEPSLTLAFEAWPSAGHPGLVQAVAELPSVLGPHEVRPLWLHHADQPGPLHPQLVDPVGADEVLRNTAASVPLSAVASRLSSPAGN